MRGSVQLPKGPQSPLHRTGKRASMPGWAQSIRGGSSSNGDSSSEEEIEVKLPKPKKDAMQSAEDDLYRRTYERMFEVH